MAIVGFSNGFNNILSIIFILLSWGTAITGIYKVNKRYSNNSNSYILISLSAALLAMLFQTFETANMVMTTDFGSIQDVVPYVTQLYLVFVIVTIAMNLTIVLKSKKKKNKY